jgi:hypothetical protein
MKYLILGVIILGALEALCLSARGAKPLLDSVIRLYAHDGTVLKEYTGAYTVEQSQCSIKFKANGRTVILGGTFSLEEIPHQEPR